MTVIDSLCLNRVEDGANTTKNSDDPWRLLSMKLLAEVEVKAVEIYTVDYDLIVTISAIEMCLD